MLGQGDNSWDTIYAGTETNYNKNVTVDQDSQFNMWTDGSSYGGMDVYCATMSLSGKVNMAINGTTTDTFRDYADKDYLGVHGNLALPTTAATWTIGCNGTLKTGQKPGWRLFDVSGTLSGAMPNFSLSGASWDTSYWNGGTGMLDSN